MGARTETAAFQLLLNRSPLPSSLLAAVHTVEVANEIDVPGMFSFKFNMLSQQGNWQGADLDTFKPGDQISVQMGIGQPKTLINAQIYSIDPDFDAYSVATISGFDAMAKLRFGNHSRVFKSRNESQIAEDVAASARVRLTSPGPPVTLNACVWQRQQTNYQFLLSRAKLLNYELVVDDQTVVYRPCAAGLSPVKTLAFPRDISRVNLRLRVPTEGSEVKFLGFDPSINKPISAQSNANEVRARMGGSESGYDFLDSFPSAAITVTDPTITKVEALQARANAEFMQNLNGFIEGDAELEGDPSLVAGVNIRLTGLSRRFDGIYYIRASRHRYDDSNGYHTSLQLRRTGA